MAIEREAEDSGCDASNHQTPLFMSGGFTVSVIHPNEFVISSLRIMLRNFWIVYVGILLNVYSITNEVVEKLT